jgi:hypothetical protein
MGLSFASQVRPVADAVNMCLASPLLIPEIMSLQKVTAEKTATAFWGQRHALMSHDETGREIVYAGPSQLSV